jgi:hypothetical protein
VILKLQNKIEEEEYRAPSNLSSLEAVHLFVLINHFNLKRMK